jgi:outer membrane protein TolC
VQRLALFSLLITTINAAFLLAAGPAHAETPAGTVDQPAGTPSALIAPPAPGGLTADDVARRSALTSHDVRARSEEKAAAAASVGQAGASFIPRLSGVARYTRLSDIGTPSLGTIVAAPPGTAPGPLPANTPLQAVPLAFPVILDNYVTQATLSIPLSDYVWRFPKLYSAARNSERSASLLEQAARLNTATDGRLAYYAWARARLQTDVAERSLASARAHLKDVSAAHQSGAASKADVLRVESQVASAELLVTRAHATTQNAEQRIRTMMHDTAGRPYAIGEDLRSTPPPEAAAKLLAKPVSAMVVEALEQRLEPRALGATAAASRAQASASRAGGLPRLDLVGNAYYSKPNSRIFPLEDKYRGTWDASVQVSWAPTDIFGAEAGQSAAMARARQLEAERASLGDAIEVEVTQARQALTESEAAIRSSERGLVAAEESYRVRRALFQNGRATSVELTDAETERSRAQLEVIATRLDRRIAEARLVHATGRDVADSAVAPR